MQNKANSEHIFIGEYREPQDPQKLRLAVKDIFDLAGVITTVGSKSRADSAPAAEDAAVIKAVLGTNRFEIIGKTNLDEFAAGATGQNVWFGDVACSWDTARMGGGSSSGSALAIARGLADVALGTDTGGSVRIPAAISGVASLKPTSGLVSTLGVYPLSQVLDTAGPMGKNIALVRELFAAMLPTQMVPAVKRDNSELKIARLRFIEAETEVDEAIDRVLEASGHEVVSVSLEDWGEAHAMAYVILAVQASLNNRSLTEARPEMIGAVPASVFAFADTLTAAEYGAALNFKSEWSFAIESLFDEFDVLACPTISTLPPRYDELDALEWGSFSRTMQFNLSGHPAANVPVSLAGAELPADATTGLQLVGPLGSDFELLDIAESFEAITLSLSR